MPTDEEMRVLTLFETQYSDFICKHFHEYLVRDHGFTNSYNWLRLILQRYGLVRAAPSWGKHRRRRPRPPLPAMLLHQNGSSHEWGPGERLDLIVTMDNARSEIYSGFFCAEEGTQSCFVGLAETIPAKGLFCALYADPASHYWHTREAGGGVDKDNPTQVGRALQQLGIELIPGYFPQARGRSERMLGTLQKRLLQELALADITDMEAANRFLRKVYLPQHNRRFMVAAEWDGSAFVSALLGQVEDILCVVGERMVGQDNTVRNAGLILQTPQDQHRWHYVKQRVRVHLHTDGIRAIFFGPRKLARYDQQGELIDPAANQQAA
ncbi:MAG: hypothetical protein PsegKO_34740 [Pseudohongiellaceae bacterium]